jgi:GntR family transcriptional repressor for pyruvate dehydrogenase complex
MGKAPVAGGKPGSRLSTSELRIDGVSGAKQSTVAAVVAESIRKQIAAGELRAGERLPSERELATALKVSRSGIREAMMQLKTQGYLVSGRGRRGTTVASLGDLSAAHSFAGLLVREAGHLADLFEFGLSVEVEAVGLADMRRLPEDLVKINEVIALMREQAEEMDPELDVAFHRAVVEAGHNVFYSRTINELMLPLRENAALILSRLSEDPLCSRSLLDQHAAIAIAVSQRDEEGARKAAVEHLQWMFRELYRMEDKESPIGQMQP